MTSITHIDNIQNMQYIFVLIASLIFNFVFLDDEENILAFYDTSSFIIYNFLNFMCI